MYVWLVLLAAALGGPPQIDVELRGSELVLAARVPAGVVTRWHRTSDGVVLATWDGKELSLYSYRVAITAVVDPTPPVPPDPLPPTPPVPPVPPDPLPPTPPVPPVPPDPNPYTPAPEWRQLVAPVSTLQMAPADARALAALYSAVGRDAAGGKFESLGWIRKALIERGQQLSLKGKYPGLADAVEKILAAGLLLENTKPTAATASLLETLAWAVWAAGR